MKKGDKVTITHSSIGKLEGRLAGLVEGKDGVWEIDLGSAGHMHVHESQLKPVQPALPDPPAPPAAQHPLVGFKGVLTLRRPVRFRGAAHPHLTHLADALGVEVLSVSEHHLRCAVHEIAFVNSEQGALEEAPDGEFAFIDTANVVGLTCRKIDNESGERP